MFAPFFLLACFGLGLFIVLAGVVLLFFSRMSLLERWVIICVIAILIASSAVTLWRSHAMRP